MRIYYEFLVGTNSFRQTPKSLSVIDDTSFNAPHSSQHDTLSGCGASNGITTVAIHANQNNGSPEKEGLPI
jgi:hypothetical protein